MSGRRYVVGIDLGTTNSALAYIDTDRVPREIVCHPLLQLVAPGAVAALMVLPSFHHHVGAHELPPGATRLPWTPADAADPDHLVGELARTQAQAVPGRGVASAKSWLCHPRVDRTKDFLPWGGAEDVPRLSPVEVSARYLRHLARAFTHETAVGIADTDVVLTVPASFDEVARELTVEAARRSGLPEPNLTLLEEPQAAFYSWLTDHARYAEQVDSGDLIFVCDIGGGTTDFSLIAVNKAEGRIGFLRTAVGDHLLLGGDNMDLALARRIERRLLDQGGKPLPPYTFQGLVAACRTAKERLLGEEPPAEWGIHVAGRGARLIGGGVRAELSRAEVEEVLLDGFFPRVDPSAPPTASHALSHGYPARARVGIQELGLPYAPDPAVTRYMAAFLRQHQAAPTCILFNGGVLRAAAIRQRILAVLHGWLGRPVRVLRNDAPDLAVARGAAYYGLSRRGEGLRISGGAARAYYVQVATGHGGAGYVCLTPRGLDEGTEVDLSARPLQVITNRPVQFRIFSSATRQGDRPGDVVHIPLEELIELPPLYTVLRYPRSSQERPIDVNLRARLTELGTLELWAVSHEPEGDRWRLQFDLRGEAGAGSSLTPGPSPIGRGEADQAGLISAAAELIDAVFAGPQPPAGLTKALVSVLGPRDLWTPTTLRALWEPLKKHREHHARTAAHEARWLNLCGFCLRPGFGYLLDDWRVKEAWRVWNAGLVHDRDEPCRLEWWILWRRISGGLSRTQQEELWKRAAPLVVPSLKRPDKKPAGPHEAAEIWRALCSCERLVVKQKIDLGEEVLRHLERRRSEWALWSLGRIGARVPLYGSIDNTVPPQVVEQWLERLLALAPPEGEGERREELGQTVAELLRLSGDRVRDVSEKLRAKAAAWLKALVPGTEGERLARVVSEVVQRQEREERFAFGDALPVGLRLRAEAESPGSLGRS